MVLIEKMGKFSIILVWFASAATAQLNENCTVSILNRNITAQPDGTWVIPNVPSNQGRVRARATCVDKGITLFGQSSLFRISTNGGVTVPPVTFGALSPIPDTLTLSVPSQSPIQPGSSVQVTVQAVYADATTANVTKAIAGTDYTSGDPTVATVSPDGLVTAVSNGAVLITAFNEGTSGFVLVNVGSAPGVSISSPANGATVVEGAVVPVTLNVTGGPIAAIALLANGQTVGTLVSPPYQFNYTTPVSLTSVSLTATATDVSGTIATSTSVTISTIVDPLTTVTGSVATQAGLPVIGAIVSCQGVSGATGPGGHFSIVHVSTAQNSIVCTATFTNSSGVTSSGSSVAVAPVRGGTTDVGTIVVGTIGSRGTDFWMSFQYFPNGSGAQISIVSETAAHFTVSAPGFSTTGTVGPTNPQAVTLPNSLQITSNQSVELKGIHVTSDAEITATFFYSHDGTHDAYLAIPSSSLGQEYFVGSYIGGPAEFVITAAADNTGVAVTPACDSVSGSKAGTPINLTLSRGQTYQYQCSTDVTGTHIVSNKPVGVVAGNGCAFIPSGSTVCDLTSEMMFPVSTLYGTDFYPVAFLDTSVRLLAARDNTSVTVDDGASTTTYSLSRGQFKEIQSSVLSLSSYHVTSNQPITILEFGGRLTVGQGNTLGGPTGLQVIPTASFTNEVRVAGSPTQAAVTFLIIVAPNSAVPSVRVDGSAPLVPFFPLPGGKYQWTYQPVAGQSVVTADAPMGVYAVGLGILNQGSSFAFPAAF